MKKVFILTLLLFVLFQVMDCHKATLMDQPSQGEKISIIPKPQQIERLTGNFIFDQKTKIIQSMRKIIAQKSFLAALVGVIVLAAAVNLIELVCSAGLPAVYTQILVGAELPTLYYYGYLLLYIFIFMLDDIIVFAIAMTTVKAFSFDTKYTRYSNLIGGIVMLILGILLIFKPSWVLFG